MLKILGIVNITEDSFSDGGLFLETEKAVEHCRQLSESGADILDLGAVSSHPDSRSISDEEEKERLSAVIHHIKNLGKMISIDTFNSQVQKFVLGQGIDFINDIQGFADPHIYEELASADCGLIMMHSIQRLGRAVKVDTDPYKLFEEILAFFDDRLRALENAGIARKRIILDPGMGFFLGKNPESSLIVLKNLRKIKQEFHLPVMVSVSRKSFLGSVTGREVEKRGPATLAAELFSAMHGADYIRTHDVASLKDAHTIWKEIQNMPTIE